MISVNSDQKKISHANKAYESFGSKSITEGNDKFDSELYVDRLKIYVYQPYVRIRSIKLDPNFKISILNSVYPLNSKYLFNGQILDSEKTFKDYNIRNENKIVLISPNMMKSNPDNIRKWLELTRDKDYFEERINLNIKEDYRKEIAKIKDIKYFRIENKPRKFGQYAKSQFISHMKVTSWAYENRKDAMLNTDFEPPDSPSCEPFPIYW